MRKQIKKKGEKSRNMCVSTAATLVVVMVMVTLPYGLYGKYMHVYVYVQGWF